jgi:chromosome transmission fidelity protein 4
LRLTRVSQNDYFILGAEDGTVCQYDIPKRELDKMLVRSSLPIRDLALSPDENWVAVSSE